MTFRHYLVRVEACFAARDWVGDRSPREAWEVCERPDWMLWLCDQLGVELRLLVLCAANCARSVLHLVPPDEDRPRQAVEAAEAWVRRLGMATSVNTAWTAVESAESAESAAWAAVNGAFRVAAAVTAAAWAATAARNAVWAATAAQTATDVRGAPVDAVRAAGVAWHVAGAAASADGGDPWRSDNEAEAAALRRYAHDIRSVIPWTHVADRLRAAGVEMPR
jgi:hypothetical protein